MNTDNCCRQLATSSVAAGGHVTTLPRPRGVMRLVQIRRVFCGRGEGRRTRQQICVERHLTAANSLYISGFSVHQVPLLHPAGGIPSPRLHPPDFLCPSWLQSLATPLLATTGRSKRKHGSGLSRINERHHQPACVLAKDGHFEHRIRC